MIKLKDVFNDPIEVSVTPKGEVWIDDISSGAYFMLTPSQARELAAALIECANKIQRKGGE